MKDDARNWIKYADENLQSAKLLLKAGILNPCLQNAQQSVEKSLKALLIENSRKLQKTHSINELVSILSGKGINININEEERDLLDSIYLPSKYPLGSSLPDFEPNNEICGECISIAERIFSDISLILGY
jgi:HEPN domain-containing protein